MNMTVKEVGGPWLRAQQTNLASADAEQLLETKEPGTRRAEQLPVRAFGDRMLNNAHTTKDTQQSTYKTKCTVSISLRYVRPGTNGGGYPWRHFPLKPSFFFRDINPDPRPPTPA